MKHLINELESGASWKSPRGLRRKCVTPEFYKQLTEHFADLIARPDFRGLLIYLMFSAKYHDNRLVLSFKDLASFMNRPPKHANTGNFLREFKKNLPADCKFEWDEFDWHGDRHKLNETRHVVKLNFGAFQPILDQELTTSSSPAGKVYLDGTPFSQKKHLTTRNEDISAANNKNFKCDDAKMIADYLNSLPLQPLNRILQYMPEAREAVEQEKKRIMLRRAQLNMQFAS